MVLAGKLVKDMQGPQTHTWAHLLEKMHFA